MLAAGTAAFVGLSDEAAKLADNVDTLIIGINSLIAILTWVSSIANTVANKDAGASTLPLAAAGYELRKYITGDLMASALDKEVQRKEMTDAEYLTEVVKRAGVLGPLTMVLDAEAVAYRNEFAPFALASPLFSMLQDFASRNKSFAEAIAGRMPIVGQSSVMRQSISSCWNSGD